MNDKYNFVTLIQNWQILYAMVYHLGKEVVTVRSLLETFLQLFDVYTSSEAIIPIKNAGCLGFGRTIVSLASIKTT